MKTANCVLLTAFLISIVNCSSAPETAAENLNASPQSYSETVNTETDARVTEAAAIVENRMQTPVPDALIQDLYKTHGKDNGAIVQSKNRAILDKYFDKNLADLIWKDLTTHQNEIGVIDFDIFYNTQDPEIKNLAVGAAKIEGDRATVPATFINFKTKNTVTYSLVKEKSAWKIADINYGRDESLLKYFRVADESVKTAEDNQSGEFEGTYQVGTTTCTVTPIKMAFEVKWKQGKGTEIFFYEDRADNKNTFSSESKEGEKANVFSFDNENYNSGTFYRADGREFPVKRIE